MSHDAVLLPEPTIIDVDGVAVATWLLEPDGPPRGPDVVLCHGTPWSAAVWSAAARHLARHRRVRLWDMPGYGASAKEEQVPVDLGSQMRRFAQLLDRWRLAAPSVIAHDVGGAVALGAHLLHGRDYASLHLWDIVALEPWGSPFFRLVSAHQEVFSQLPPELHAALVREYIAGAARQPLTPAWVEILTEPWLGPTGQAAFYRQISQLRVEDTRPVVDRLGELRCPVRIGWGEDDPWIAVEQAHRLRRALPGDPETTTLAGVGHLGPVESPAAIHRELDAWLAERLTSRG